MTFPTRLNIGSGKDFRDDCLNLDIADYRSPDILFDLNEPLPANGLRYATERFGEIGLTKGSFDQIIANDVLEHITNLTTAMKTCLDLLKVGGVFDISVPYDLSLGAWQDPTHVRAFNENSWLYYTDWFWYLQWSEARFVHNKQLSLQLSPLGEELRQQGTSLKEIARTPRAVDAMSVSLKKVTLTANDIRQLEHFRGQSRSLQSAAPVPVYIRPTTRYCIWKVCPAGFDHSAAFDELARGLNAGLAQLGHDAPIVDNPSEAVGTTIVLGAHLIPTLRRVQLPEDVILYNTEQIQGGTPWMNPEYKALLSTYPVWDYSERNIAALKAMINVQNVTLCPVGYEPELTSINDAAEHDIDVFFYGSFNNRRSWILDELSARGLKVVQKYGVYGAERDAYIARSKIVINVHFYEAHIFEIIRLSYLLANRRFVISESSYEPNIDARYQDGMVICPFDEIVENCVRYAKDDEARRAIATRGFEIFSQHTQAEYLKMVLTESAAR